MTDQRQFTMPTITPAQRLFINVRREHKDTFAAIVRLRKAGYKVWRSSIHGLHSVNGRNYTASQVIEMANLATRSATS